MLGRTILPADDLPGAPPVVVASHAFWKYRLGGRTDAIGTVIDLNGRRATVHRRRGGRLPRNPTRRPDDLAPHRGVAVPGSPAAAAKRPRGPHLELAESGRPYAFRNVSRAGAGPPRRRERPASGTITPIARPRRTSSAFDRRGRRPPASPTRDRSSSFSSSCSGSSPWFSRSRASTSPAFFSPSGAAASRDRNPAGDWSGSDPAGATAADRVPPSLRRGRWLLLSLTVSDALLEVLSRFRTSDGFSLRLVVTSVSGATSSLRLGFRSWRAWPSVSRRRCRPLARTCGPRCPRPALRRAAAIGFGVLPRGPGRADPRSARRDRPFREEPSERPRDRHGIPPGSHRGGFRQSRARSLRRGGRCEFLPTRHPGALPRAFRRRSHLDIDDALDAGLRHGVGHLRGVYPGSERGARDRGRRRRPGILSNARHSAPRGPRIRRARRREFRQRRDRQRSAGSAVRKPGLLAREDRPARDRFGDRDRRGARFEVPRADRDASTPDLRAAPPAVGRLRVVASRRPRPLPPRPANSAPEQRARALEPARRFPSTTRGPWTTAWPISCSLNESPRRCSGSSVSSL